MGIVFVSEEFAIKNLPTYAGGLGILAGDLFYTAEDLKYNFYGITFVNRKGYNAYNVKDKQIVEEPEGYEPLEYFIKVDEEFDINLKNNLTIRFDVWRYSLAFSRLYLIDTNIQENPEWLRGLSDRLYYEKNEEERILKSLILGLGTLEIVDKLDLKVDKFHLNESHGGFLAIELYKRYKDIDKVREKVVFTTHSPIAGHLSFNYDLVEKYYDIPEEIKKISPNKLDLTKVLYYLSGYKNAVSLKHREVTKRLMGYDFDYITNGVYHLRWINRKMAYLYDTYIPGWRNEPTKLAYADSIPLSEFEKIKGQLRRELIEYVNTNAYLNKSFSEDRITISVRRRLTEYKRFHMILWRLEKFEELNKKYKIQFLLSGVFHPKDEYVKNTLKWIIDIMSTLDSPIALILKRGEELEKYIISGTDLFLHVPRPPFEACGTSWMRAGLNGTPTLYSIDGGALEIIIDGYNGWYFGKNTYDPAQNKEDEDINDFYNKLDKILGLYRDNYKEYLRVGINAIKTIGPLFNTYRCFKEYISKAYK